MQILQTQRLALREFVPEDASSLATILWKEVTRVNLLHYVYAIRRERAGATV